MCYQRCFLDNTCINSGGNTTDPGCRGIIHEVANLYNAHQLYCENPGWPAPNGKGDNVIIKLGRCCPWDGRELDPWGQ